MLTLEEIQATKINEDVAREAHTQAEKRLEDALATKASHEQKAFALLRAYVAIALALLSAFGFFASSEQHVIAPAFLFTGLLYALGAILSVVALLPQTYGAIGSHPSAWLRRGVIDGDTGALAANLAYETFFHGARISASADANRKKANLIRAALIVGVGSPIVLWLLIVAAG